MIQKKEIENIEKKFVKIKCPICGMELEDLLEYVTASERMET